MQMPADLEARIVPSQADGIFRGGLAHHQAGALQYTLTMGMEDRLVNLLAHPKIICNEKHFSAVHVCRRFCPNVCVDAIPDHRGHGFYWTPCGASASRPGSGSTRLLPNPGEGAAVVW